MEYTIGWPLDEPTVAGIEQLPESDWGAAVHADGALDPAAQVADLTGIMRHPPDADRLATWPGCMRLIARRTPRPATKPAKLGEHPDWEYGAFVTNTPGGQVQFLDAGHRTQAHVEDRMTQFKACGARNLPSIDYGPQHRLAATGRPGPSLLSAPARPVTHARRRILKIPPGWKWSGDLATAWDHLQALHPI